MVKCMYAGQVCVVHLSLFVQFFLEGVPPGCSNSASGVSMPRFWPH